VNRYTEHMTEKKKSAIIIGSGFGGLGSAAILAKAGWDVTVLEKNEMVGGRATVFEARKQKNGTWKSFNSLSDDKELFRFDRGPSWYLMPDVFEHFFDILGEDVHKHLDLRKLGPSYRIFYKDEDKHVDIYSDLKKDLPTIEAIEEGAADQLEKYLDQAGYQYDVAKDRFMYKNYDSWRDFMTKEMATEGRKLSVFKTMDKYVKGYFKTDQLQKIMQYPLVFLGSSPYNTPAIYNIMSHIDFNMGVFYPQGGLYKITEALESIAKKNGAKFKVKSGVKQILVHGGKADGVVLDDGKKLMADIIISNADIHHTETKLLPPEHRERTEKYWSKRTLAPSALIMYLGVKGEYKNLKHHNLLFAKDWKHNFAQIFDRPAWPDDPSLYVCAPSKTDKSVAPAGHENMFVLVPIAPGLKYTEKQLEKYADKVLETMESEMKLPNLRENIVFKELFSVKDFKQRYNSQDGTALGLAHTLKQTAIFRPNNVSKKVDSLYYVGAGTNPGIGMPITLISAELMYKRLIGEKTSGPLDKIE
jgi:phytoene desaturase